MKILVVASDGATLGLAQGLVREGHDVDVFPLDMPLTYTGKDIYTITTNLWKAVQECNFIVADRGFDKLYTRARSYNKPIIGAHPMTDVLNGDCVKEFELGMRLGVRYPKTELFSDGSKLQPKILEGKYRRYYVKVARKTFVCTAPQWLAWAMYQLPVGERCLLQEEVKGEEISIVGWFNGLSWVQPFFYSTPRAHQMKAVAMLAEKKATELTNETIFPFGAWLKKIDYKGPVTADLIVSEKEFYVRRLRIGMTMPATLAMMEGLKGTDICQFLNQLAFSAGSPDISFDYLTAIEIDNRDADMYGAPILGISEGNKSKIFLQGAYTADGEFMMSGEIEPVYTAVSHGQDLKEASRRVYRTIENVQFPRMYFVSNLEGIAGRTFNQLKSWGAL